VSLTDRLERFFREHPHTWIDGKDLAGTAGTYAWRSRVSDVRDRFRQIPGAPFNPLINRQRRYKVGTRTYVISEYMAVLP
jgi:hypothetical protein